MSTRRIISIICGLGIAALPGLSQAAARADSLALGASHSEAGGLSAPSPVAVSWDVTLASKYLFLGIDLSDENPVLQPEVILAVKNLSFTFWFNHDLERQKPNELDFVLQYAWELGRFSVSPGYAYFTYPHRTPAWDPSQELRLDLSCAALLSPSLSINHDFDAGKGTYLTLGVSQELLQLEVPLTVGANVFYQDRYYEQSGFTAAEFNVGVAYPAGPFEISPSISYFATWDNGDFRGDSAVPSTWLFALNVAQSF